MTRQRHPRSQLAAERGSAFGSLNWELAQQRAKTDAHAASIVMVANMALQASGEVDGRAIAEEAPDFTLPDATRRMVRLRERLDVGPVVLVFYRGGWCPYCNITVAALERQLDNIGALGASLMAISPQRPDDALSITERHGLRFDVLSDVHQSVIRDYGIQYRVPRVLQDVQLNVFKNDVAELNADGSWNLPVPATFVIDRQGIIRARHVGAEYTQRMEPAAILAALRALNPP